ncbi:hypothetical protein B5V02_17930 [Mesorhizobium kowhaii]|uniref:Uncharacterized protein n=1 Tax=Mesorhizobium kowhaii TaxID=1300272 RepID=A0A2W7C1X5_9HYPH|nr:hypothetical protein B5V02_17930 [Mesorhizobium kowhaii]
MTDPECEECLSHGQQRPAAGLINVLTHAQGRFPHIPAHGVFGGFHLSGISESSLPETVEALAKFDRNWRALAYSFAAPVNWSAARDRGQWPQA